jgi:oligoendopeptidase F
MANHLQTISWDNSNIYKSFSDPQIQKDLKATAEKISELKTAAAVYDRPVANDLESTIPHARKTYRLRLDVDITLSTLGTYANTAMSVNALDYAAQDLSGAVIQLSAQLKKAIKPLDIFLMRSSQSYLDQFLADESVSELKFLLNHQKKASEFLLSSAEEILLEGHSVDGMQAWSRLYNDLAGTMAVDLDGAKMGLSAAANILFQADRPARELAYRAIEKAWQQNEITATAILNSLTGWRLENNQARSKTRELHYLEKACHDSKIERTTLDTLMTVAYENRALGHRAVGLMAAEMGIARAAPWDILASYPAETAGSMITFPAAMNIVISAFSGFDPAMGEFAKMMMDRRWIDSKPSENRRGGAHCTGFIKTREPRVFLTFDGSMKNVITLAHELGHAYHNWIMRDLKPCETIYSMPLAETASLFAENLVRDAVLAASTSTEEKKAILWQEVESASSMLLNIPARFEFEKSLYELRKKKSISVPEIKDLNRQAWRRWYGDSLTEHNEMFWASKMHFAFSATTFYNYPYLFGYLFSLGIYAKRKEYGGAFKALYLDILRDTGRMTAEDLVAKHLKEDISKPEFWQKSLRIVEQSVNEFGRLQSPVRSPKSSVAASSHASTLAP